MPDNSTGQQTTDSPLSDLTTTKIALVMAGGVSLGSFEAGVTTELLYALDTLNRRSAETGRHFELDVLTGGSAGGMTATLAARILMHDLPGRRLDLYRAWVEEINIRRLLAGPPANAVLSKQPLFEIIDGLLLRGHDQPPVAPASFAPDVLRLSLSLSNMHGMTYSLSALTGGNFVTTLFSDMGRFQIHRGGPGSPVEVFHSARPRPLPTTWQQLAHTAVACGNFPLAFQPEQLVRPTGAYPGAVETNDQGLFGRGLCFIDGGLFNNEPLGEAIDRAREADGDNHGRRLFLLVDPNINTTRHRADITAEDSFLRHVQRLMEMIYGESTARDWLRADRFNQEIDWRDRLVQQLSNILSGARLSDSARHVETLEELASEILQRRPRSARASSARRQDPTDLDENLQSMKEQTAIARAADRLDANKRRILELTTLALNHISHLAGKSEVHLSQIGANRDELAGDELEGFVGFFDQRWRTYDYRIGRVKAHEQLQEILGIEYEREPRDTNGETSHEHQEHEDYDIPDAWRREFPSVQIQDARRQDRQDLYDALLQRFDVLAGELDMGNVASWALKQFFLKRQLRTWLAL